MIDIVPIVFVSGLLLGFFSGVLMLRAYFIISDGGFKKFYGPNLTNVWKKVKNFRVDPTKEDNDTLNRLYMWIYLTRQTGLGLIFLAFIAYFLIFAFGLQ